MRVAGDLDAPVRTVAVCGGSGGDFLADAAAVADVYVTSDLRHHRAQDHLVDGGCALVDVAHWASEWPWLPGRRRRTAERPRRARQYGGGPRVPDPDGSVDPAPREHPLNADPATQLRLLELQDKDTRLGQLAHRAEDAPGRRRGSRSCEDRLARLRDQVVAAETILGDLEHDQVRADHDVEQVRERMTRDRQLMDSGTIGDPKQLQSLQAELDSLARRQSDLEDVELEIMERVEGARAAVAQLTGERDELARECETVASSVHDQRADIDDERGIVEGERAAIATEIPADLLGLYDKIRADHGGLGAAPLHRGTCEGCRLKLPPTEIEALRDGAARRRHPVRGVPPHPGAHPRVRALGAIRR